MQVGTLVVFNNHWLGCVTYCDAHRATCVLESGNTINANLDAFEII